MHRLTRMFALFLCLALPVLVHAVGDEGDTKTKIAKGDIPPPGLGSTFEGEPVLTTQFAGRVMVVTFWASWCGPCLNELTLLEKIQILGKDRIKIVAVNIESRIKFRAIKQALPDLTIQLTSDPRQRYADAYGVNGIPHMVIIGKDGKVVAVHRGYNDAALPGLLKEINAELAKG